MTKLCKFLEGENTTQWRKVQQKKAWGRVCIGCLLDFRNQMESDRIDRKLGYQILSYPSGDSQTIDFRITGGKFIDDELQTKLDEETIEKEVENHPQAYQSIFQTDRRAHFHSGQRRKKWK